MEIEYEAEDSAGSESNSKSQLDGTSENSRESSASGLIVKTPNQVNESFVTNFKTYGKRPFQDVHQGSTKRARKKIVPLRARSAEQQPTTPQPTSTLRIVSTVSNHPSMQNQNQVRKVIKVDLTDYKSMQQENKALKEILTKFTQEAEHIQKTMTNWTKILKSFSKSAPKATRVVSTSESQQDPPKATHDDNNSTTETTPQVRMSPVPTSLVRVKQNPNKTLKVTQKAIEVQRKLNAPNLLQHLLPKSKAVTITVNSSASDEAKERESEKPEGDTSHIDLPSAPPKKSQEKVFLVQPKMPIACIKTFIKFEKDLRDKVYFDFIHQLIYRKQGSKNFGSAVSRLTFSTLLEQIVHHDVFKFFVWEQATEGQHVRTNRLRMVDFPRFINLFLSLSSRIFASNKDPSLVEPIVINILRSHIIKANVKRPTSAPAARKSKSVVVLNYDLNRDREDSESPPVEAPTTSNKNDSNNVSKPLTEDDLEKYFTTETVLEPAEADDDDDDDDVQDVTPAPVSIDIADDSD